MWFLVTVVKGSRHYEPDSPIGNRVLISDTCEMVISGRASYHSSYNFEARQGNEAFILNEFPGKSSSDDLTGKFLDMARQMGAVMVAAPA